MGRDKDNVYCLLNHNREKKSIAFGQEYTCCRDLLIRDSLTENEGFENAVRLMSLIIEKGTYSGTYQNINKTGGREHSAACFAVLKD